MRSSVYVVFLIFLMSFGFLFSCKSDSQKDSKTGAVEGNEITELTGTLNVEGDDVLHVLINDFISEFKKDYPNVKINLTVSNSSSALKEMDDENIDLVFVSTPEQSINSEKYSRVPFARDILVLIVNFNNRFLQTLVMYGISQNVISDILTQNITSWKMVNARIEQEEPLVLYIPPRQSGTTEYLAKFTGLPRNMIKTEDVIFERDVPVNVSNQPISAGFCSHTLAYDKHSKVRRSGLYVVGIDADNSNFLENNELIYDDLMELATAVKHNKAPGHLIREFSFVYPNESDQKELIDLFIGFVREKGDPFIEKHHFYTINSKSKSNTQN